MERKTIASLFIAGLMIFSIVGFMLVDVGVSEQKRTYGDFTFYRTESGWKTNSGVKDVLFNFFPDQVSQVLVDTKAALILTNTPVLGVTYDPNSSSAQSFGQIQYYLEQVFQDNDHFFVARGLTNASGFSALHEISCLNSSQSFPVLVLERGNETKIVSEGYCIHAQAASNQDLFLILDRIVYVIMGVL